MNELPSRTVLHDWHSSHGGKMVDFAGWSMPVQYGTGIIAEHLATRRGAGLFDVSHMGRFRVSGPGAESFLLRTLTNNASGLDPWQAQYTFIANASGGVVDDAYLYRLAAHDFLLVVNAGNRAVDWEWLSRYLPERGALATKPRAPCCRSRSARRRVPVVYARAARDKRNRISVAVSGPELTSRNRLHAIVFLSSSRPSRTTLWPAREAGGTRWPGPGLAAARSGLPLRAQLPWTRWPRHPALREFPRPIRRQDERGERLRRRSRVAGSARGIRADPAARARDATVGQASDAPGSSDCGIRRPAAAATGLQGRPSRRGRGMGHLGHHRAVHRVRRRGARRKARRGARDAPDRPRAAAFRPRAGQRRSAPRGGDRRPGQRHDRAGRGTQRLAACAVRAPVRGIRATRRGGVRPARSEALAARLAEQAEGPSVAAHRCVNLILRRPASRSSWNVCASPIPPGATTSTTSSVPWG